MQQMMGFGCGQQNEDADLSRAAYLGGRRAGKKIQHYL